MKRKTKTKLSQGDIAAILGVSREHLNRVLHGHRESKSLMGRYTQFLGSLPKASKED